MGFPLAMLILQLALPRLHLLDHKKRRERGAFPFKPTRHDGRLSVASCHLLSRFDHTGELLVGDQEQL